MDESDDRDGPAGPDGRDGRGDRDGRDGGDPPGIHPRTQDALLDHYAEMRADVRAGDATRSRLLRHGLVVVVVVLALAYVEPGYQWVTSAVPVVLTLLFVAGVAAETRTLQRARQLIAVERLLDVPGLDYEREHGALSERGGRLRDRLLTHALVGCFLVLWLGSMAGGLVEFHADPPTVAGWPVSTAVPAAVYLVLVAMVTVAAWTYLAARSEHRLATHRALHDRDARQRRLDEFVAAGADGALPGADDAEEQSGGDGATAVPDPAVDGAEDDGAEDDGAEDDGAGDAAADAAADDT